MFRKTALATALLLGLSPLAANAADFTFNLNIPAATGSFTDSSNNVWNYSIPSAVNIGTLNFTKAAGGAVAPTNDVATACAGGSPATTLCQSAAYSVTAGHSYIINPSACGAGCNTNTAAVISSVSDTAGLLSCPATAAAKNVTATHMRTELWKCVATGTGSTQVKTTWSTGVVWSNVEIADEAASLTDDGIGASSDSTGTSISRATSAATTQSNELIVSAFYCGFQGGETIGSPYQFLTAGNALGYLVVDSAGVQTVTGTCPSNGTSDFAVAIAAFH